MTEVFPIDEPIFVSNFKHIFNDEHEVSYHRILRKIICGQGANYYKFNIKDYELHDAMNRFTHGFVVLDRKLPIQNDIGIFKQYLLKGFALFYMDGNDTHLTTLALCANNLNTKDLLVETIKNYCIDNIIYEWRLFLFPIIEEINYYRKHGFDTGQYVYNNNKIDVVSMYYKFTYDEHENCINLI